MACGGNMKIVVGTRGQYYVGIKESFELNSEEQLVKIEVICGQFMERIRFSTNRGRISKWMGESLSIAPRRITLGESLIQNDPLRKYIVGFFGKASSSRLLSLGVIVRIVTKQNIFSYKWLGTNSQMCQDKYVRDKKDRDIPPIFMKKDKDSSLFSQDQNTACLEFSSLMKLRSDHIFHALNKSINFSHRLWRLSHKHSKFDFLKPLSKLQIIIGLTTWYFEALAFRLKDEMSAVTNNNNRTRRLKNKIKSKTQHINLIKTIKIGIKELKNESDTLFGTCEKWDKEQMKEMQTNIIEKRSRIDLSNKNRDFYGKLIGKAHNNVCFEESSIK